MDNKIDYQLGKDCFEKFLHKLEDNGNDLSKEGLDETIHSATNLAATVCAAITGTMVKYHVPFDSVKDASDALLDAFGAMKIGTEATLIKEMLYGKDDASDGLKS